MSTVSFQEVYDVAGNVNYFYKPSEFINLPKLQSVSKINDPRIKIMNNPEIVKVPLDLYRKVLEELRSRQSELLDYRDHDVASYITDLVNEFEKCEKDSRS